MTLASGIKGKQADDMRTERAWSRLSRLSTALLAIRIGGAAAGFLAQLLLAHLLSPDDLGTFFVVTSFATVAGLVAAQGYQSIAARFVTRYGVRGPRKCLSGFLWQARRDALGAGLAMAAMVALVAVVWPSFDLDARIACAAGAIGIPALTLFALYPSLAGAIKRFGLCFVPETLARPALFLIIIAALAYWQIPLGAGSAILVYVLLTGVLAIYQYVAVTRLLPTPRRLAHAGIRRLWRQEAWPLVIAVLFTSFFADLAIIIASPFLEGADVAAFSICMKTALLLGFIVQVSHQVALPEMAEARARNDTGGTPELLWRTGLAPILFCTAAMLASALAGDRFLALFAPEYARAQGVLTLLIGCQLLRALAGPSSYALTLEGGQRANSLICAGATVVLAAGSATLGAPFGLNGAAAAVLLTYLSWLAATGLWLHRTRGVRTDIVSLLRHVAAAAGPARP